MKKRKALIVTIGYIIGIIWGLYCKSSIVLLYASIVLISIIINKIKRKKHRFKIISFSRYIKYIKLVFDYNVLILLIIFSLISNIVVNNMNKKYENLYKGKEDISLVARVISNKKVEDEISTYTIKIVNLDNKKEYRNTKLILKTRGKVNLEYGDKIYLFGKFQEPNIRRNYGGFDYKNYLKTKKIYGTIDAESIEILKRNCNNYIFTLSNDIFLTIKNNLEKIYEKENAQLILGVMLGYTEEIEDKIKEDFKISNISHVLAVSGMHIMYLITGISYVLDKKCGKRKTKIVICIILIIYMFITNFSPSIVRAGIMGIITLLSSIFHRKKDVSVAIAISLLIILVYNPFLITSTSVLLSYAGTLGIIIFSKNVFRILKKVRIKDKRIKYKINKKILKLDLKIKSLLSVSISAQALIIPIMICLSNTVSISTLIINLLLSFVIGPIVLLGFIQIIISFISINLAKLLSYIINFFLSLLLQISKLGNILPLSKIYITTPCLVSIIVYYITLIIINYIFNIYSLKERNSFQNRIKNLLSLAKYNFNKFKQRVYRMVLLILTFLVLILLFPKNLKIYFIDVGQGDSTLIKTPSNKTVLIDGGGSLNDKYDVGEKILLPYLLDRKVKKIDYMIISHFDQDHVRSGFCML